MSKLQPGMIAALALHEPAPLTQHAALRCQQRSIPRYVIDLLVDFGNEEPAPGGCYRYFFTKRTWQAFSVACGSRLKEFERFRSAYAVVGQGGQIVTVGWLH
ncbi:hypothetical protein [Erythrobacter sp. Dej080120_24]|uniref:hypothetical protein n=1 Tax=Erythrobacter sp. Dej080120_24 TaxID=3024837 RepID=UPI0030C76D3A